MLKNTAIVCLAASLLLLAGCKKHAASTQPGGAPAAKRTLMVYAAASLTESFTELGKAFEAANPGVSVVSNFAGSQQLRSQMEHGATADVFASANMTEMSAMVKGGLVAADGPRVFARNKLVVVVSRKQADSVTAFADLAKPGVKLVVGDASVPVGKYTLKMLEQAGAQGTWGSDFKSRVLANVLSQEQDVKWVLAKVRLGEADAGIVYVSDVTPQAAKEVATVAVPEAINQIAEYPIAPLVHAPQGELAAAFVHLVLSPNGQQVLAKYGFIPVETAGAGSAK